MIMAGFGLVAKYGIEYLAEVVKYIPDPKKPTSSTDKLANPK